VNRAWLPAVLVVLLPVGCNEQAVQPTPPAAPQPVAPAAPPAPAAPAAAVQAEAMERALTVDPLESVPEDGRLVIRAHLRNPTAAEIRPAVSWDATGTWWQGEKATAAPIPPGGRGDIEIQARVGRRLFPLPQARIEVVDGKKVLHAWDFLPQALAPVAPTVREWHIIGPFDLGLPGPPASEKDQKERYLKGPLPGWRDLLPPEKDTDLGATYVGKDGRQVRWQTVRTGPDGLVDLRAACGAEDAVACAVAYIYCPAAGRHDFFAGGDDSILVRINGREVWTKHALRHAKADEDYFAADLSEGWNAVSVKAAHRSGAWGFYFRVIDPERQLKFALRPGAGK
jgi:hypothetical protein